MPRVLRLTGTDGSSNGTLSRHASILVPALLLALALAGGCRSSEPRISRLTMVTGLAEIQSAIRVVVDRHGIPHIYAASRTDAAFALGWFHARDRFLQMDVSRRSGWGRLSEILGPGAIEEDRFARILGLPRSAQAAWDSTPAGSSERGIILAYTRGINAFLGGSSAAEIPGFYAARDLQPEPWKPADCFAIHRKFAAELCHSFSDVMLQLVAEGLGREAAEELFPLERDPRAPVVRHPVHADSILGRNEGPPAGGAAGSPGTAASEETGLADAARDILERFGGLRPRFAARGSRASNNWAVSGSRATGGKPILCGDPHLEFTRPSIFYTAHLVTPGLGVIGVTVPGLPAVVFGHNGFIAWSGTNSQADVTDFYVESFDPKNPDRYLHRRRWLDVQKSEEVIKVLGKEDERFTVRRTIHGPMVNERGKTLAMRWIGEMPSNEIVSLLRINAAKNLQEFLDALREYAAPAMNFIFADVEGNIAIRPSGRIPIRGRGLGRYPADGAGGEHEWINFIPFNVMPLSVNPPEGYLLSANQRLAPLDYPYYLGWEFDPSFRARRIDEVLSQSQFATVASMVRLQLDAVDLCSQELIPMLGEAFSRDPPQDPVARLALRMLLGWDCTVRPERAEPTIAWRWLRVFADQVWEDEWEKAKIPRSGNWGFCPNGWQPPLDHLVKLAREQPDSRWFDDVRTPAREDRNAILRRSFLETVSRLVAEHGPGVASWRWGERNQLVIPDLLKDPDRTYNGGQIPGNGNTVSPGGEGGAVTVGAVYRLVAPLGNLAAARGAGPGIQAAVPPGANAEFLLSRQVQTYLDGDYLPLLYYTYPGDFPDGEIREMLLLVPRPAAVESITR